MKIRLRLLLFSVIGAGLFFSAGFLAGQRWFSSPSAESGVNRQRGRTTAKFQTDYSADVPIQASKKTVDAPQTPASLENQMQAQISKVETARLEMMEFMKKHNIVDLSGLDQSPANIKWLERYTSEITTVLDALRGLEGLALIEAYMKHTVQSSTPIKRYPEDRAEEAQLEKLEQEGYEADSPEVIVLKESMQSKFQAMEKAATDYRKTLEGRLAEMRKENHRRVPTKEEQETQGGYAKLKQNYQSQVQLLNVMREHRERVEVDVGILLKTGQ